MNTFFRQVADMLSNMLAQRARRRYESQTVNEALDEGISYEQAGRDLMLARINLANSDLVEEHVTPIWRNPRTGAVLYVGSHLAAENSTLLLNLNISSIVNCTRPGNNGKGELPNYHESSPYNFKYYNFPIARWKSLTAGGSSDPSTNQDRALLELFLGMFHFVEKSLNEGQSVLIHCLAGAHRAGTTGIAALMYFSSMSKEEATVVCKTLRPIVDPIGNLGVCLTLLERCLATYRAESKQESSNSSESDSSRAKKSGHSNHSDGSKSKYDALSPRTMAGRKWWLSNKRVVPVDFADVKDVSNSPPSSAPRKKRSIFYYFDRIRYFSAPVVSNTLKPRRVRTNTFPHSTLLEAAD